nr:hypothetical protein GCM10020241_03420 [Streptoalloteichus tenebrarius]
MAIDSSIGRCAPARPWAPARPPASSTGEGGSSAGTVSRLITPSGAPRGGPRRSTSAVDGRGSPLLIVLTAGNANDTIVIEEGLADIRIAPPGRRARMPGRSG